MIVCLCNRVSDRDIRRAVQVHGVRDFEVLKDLTRAASCCGCCHDCARMVFDEALAQSAPASRDEPVVSA
ncbi:MAG: (2Fe-2S)-binding protein [Vitreoscilla sp.]|nr:(2Fe-2S)-binding protein [Vitreoscilla sp.]